MFSWKTLVITLTLSLAGALFVQYHWYGGPAAHFPPGADHDPDHEQAAGPSAAVTVTTAGDERPAQMSPKTRPSLQANAPAYAPTSEVPPDVTDPAQTTPLAHAAEVTGTPLTRPYLEDDRDLARKVAEANEPPEPSRMTAQDRALLEQMGVDLEQAGRIDDSVDFTHWFPGRGAALFGADGQPLPERRGPDSLPPDDRD